MLKAFIVFPYSKITFSQVKQSNQLASVYSLENNEWMPIGNSLGDIIRDLIEWNGNQLYVTSEGDYPLMVLGDENTWMPVAVPFTGTSINDLESITVICTAIA
ncbi:MAG: hypothetical protein R2809_14115 [Flavobacteriales bacterium]